MSGLEPPKYQELYDALLEFDGDILKQIVRYPLGKKLNVIVYTEQAYGKVVPDFLTWLDQQGPPAIEKTLQGAMLIKPPRSLVRTFCEKYYPRALDPLDAGIVVKSVTHGLDVLGDFTANPQIAQTVAQFHNDFEVTRDQIRNVKKYKALHDALHELQVRLAAIIDTIERSQVEPRSLRNLASYAVDLRRLARSARNEISGLPAIPSLTAEEDWIDSFDAAISAMDAAARSQQPANAKTFAGISSTLSGLLREPPRINSLLIYAASALRFESFAKTMDLITDKLDSFPEASRSILGQLVESAGAVNVLRTRLNELVGAHQEWQWLNNQLDLAEASSGYQPQGRVPKWQQFQPRLKALADRSAKEDWSQEIMKALADWIAVTPTADPPDDQAREKAEVAFAEFRRDCLYRFFDVDKELKELSDHAVQIAAALDNMLNRQTAGAGA
jgi:hypothetical protein